MRELPITLNRFLESRYWAGAPPVVGFAAKSLVETLTSTEELNAMFGGYLEYERIGDGERYLGVWGSRKVARLIRVLRGRGAVVPVVSSEPNTFRQRVRHSS